MFKAKHEISPVYVKRIFESVDNGYLAYVMQICLDPVLTLYNMQNIQFDT